MSVPVHIRRESLAIMHPRLLTHDDGDDGEGTHAHIVLARVSSLSSPFPSPSLLASLIAL